MCTDYFPLFYLKESLPICRPFGVSTFNHTFCLRPPPLPLPDPNLLTYSYILIFSPKFANSTVTKGGGFLSHKLQPNIYTISSPSKIKPIFHCNAKLLALGLCVGYGPQREGFSFPITTCWYLKSLVDLTPTPADLTQAQRKQVEYRSRWVSSRWGLRWPCTIHAVCVNSRFIYVGCQRE